jgi:hypothetical protein
MAKPNASRTRLDAPSAAIRYSQRTDRTSPDRRLRSLATTYPVLVNSEEFRAEAQLNLRKRFCVPAQFSSEGILCNHANVDRAARAGYITAGRFDAADLPFG